MDRKRILLLIIFTIVVTIIGYFLYKVFFAPTTEFPTQTPTTTGQITPGGLPTAEEGVDRPAITDEERELPVAGAGRITEEIEPVVPPSIVNQLTDNQIKNAKVDKLGQVNLYNEKDGKFYRIKKDGTTELLSEDVFYRVDNVTWSPNDKEAVLEYPDGSNIYYNFETKKQVSLPKHWEEFSFSPLADKIAAKSMALSSENKWLISSNVDGSNVTLIEPLGKNADKVTVDWSPNKQVIALSQTGQALGADRQEILLIGQHGENFKSIVVEGRGFESRWSPTGEKLLYSVYSARSDYKPELWIVGASGDAIGTNRKTLNVNTWAEKCNFSGDRFVYCAVPSTLQQGAGFAPQVADNTPDVIYRIDTQTGTRTRIPTDGQHTVESLFTSEDGGTLYFTDKRQDGLFEVDI